jgi:DivIVA domain-containing protein
MVLRAGAGERLEAPEMMFWFQLAVVVLLLIAVGWIAVGGGGHMSPPTPDRPDPAVPETGLLGRGDIDKVRFSVGARGYRMDEVDDVLDRLAYEIDVRERRIVELEGHPGEGTVAAPVIAPPQEPSSATVTEPGSEVQGEENGPGEQSERA